MFFGAEEFEYYPAVKHYFLEMKERPSYKKAGVIDKLEDASYYSHMQEYKERS